MGGWTTGRPRVLSPPGAGDPTPGRARVNPDSAEGRTPRGWRRRLLGGLAGLAVLALSALAGLWVAEQAGPERLRREIEHRLGQVTGSPSFLPSLEVRLGLPVEFVGRGLSLWDGALEVETLTARVGVAAALVGKLDVTRLEAEGLVLHLRGGGDRELSPPWLSPRAEEGAAGASSEESGLEGVAGAVAGVMRAVLSKPFLADRVEVRGGRVEIDWTRDSDPLRLAFTGVEGDLWHSQLLDRSVLQLRAAVEREGRPGGRFELEAQRSAEGDHALGLAFAELDLALVDELLPDGAATLSGGASGVADLALPGDASPASLDFEVLANELVVAGETPWWSSPRASLRGRFEAEPGGLRLRGGRVVSDPVDLQLQLDLGRPLGADSDLDIVAGLAEVTVKQASALLDILPLLDGEPARALLDSVEAGRISALSLSGAGSLDSWRNAMTGKSGSLRERLRVQAVVDDLRVRLDSDDRIDRAGFRLELLGDTLTLAKARGLREGHPLPLLDLELQGLSHLLDADLERRVPEHDGAVLAGLPLLLELFEPDPDGGEDRKFRSPHIEVQVERLAHPTLLWPVRQMSLSVDAYEGGLTAQVARATWAGVPLHGHLDWNGDRQHLSAKVALAPRPAGASGGALNASADGLDPLRADREWARGSFRIDRMESRVWSHEWLAGDFRMKGARLRFAGLQSELLPRGSARGRGEIDLGHVDHLPYRFAVDARDLDADAVFSQTGLGQGLVTGTLDLTGDIRDRYEPGGHPLAHLGGELSLLARDGELRREMPVVLALTLSSDIFRLNPGGDTVRYDTCQATLEAEEGVVRTSGFQLDGPDVRLFGSGSLDLGRPSQRIDAELAVFLLRPVDQALGSIPIVGTLLLGDAENLFAAYFRVRGPWKAPTATAQPLRSFYTGPLRLMEKVPGVVRRGVEALGGAVRPAPAESSRPRLWRRSSAPASEAETLPEEPATPGTPQ